MTAFSPKVEYVYRKQLEEAKFIIVNKTDSVDGEVRRALVDRLGQEFPRAEVRCVSAQTGDGVEAWLDELWAAESVEERTMSLDYDRYAEGEALLGWLNATLTLNADAPLDADELLVALAKQMQGFVQDRNGEIAHLKMPLDGGDPMGHISVVSVVRGDGEVERRHRFDLPATDVDHVAHRLEREERDPDRQGDFEEPG